MANNQLKVEGLSPRVLPSSSSKEKYVPEFTGGDFDGYSDPLDFIIQVFDERKKYEGSEYPSYLFNTISSDKYVKESDKYYNPSMITTPFYTRYALNSIAKERGYEDLINEEDYEDERLIDSENVQVIKQLATRISEESKDRDLTPSEEAFLERYPSMIADRTGMAKGGLAMDDQMNKLFMARGGLKDDGMNMDPVSGNEVPPGSLAQEVRDDIPAQLSDGEYVVPADVVRYYGVKFFEDLRQEAKVGLSDMEMNGRIGGEPAPDMSMREGAGTSSRIPPEMLAAIASEAQLASGQMMNKGGVVSGYATGGNVFNKLSQSVSSLVPSVAEDTTDTTDTTTDTTRSYKSETPTFNPLDYMAGYPGIVGSSTIGQIGTTLPGYTYRYIDPLTGKLIDVKPGETPPPGAIPLETAPVEEEDYDDGNLWENRPEPVDPTTFNPEDMNGVNFLDPLAGIDAALAPGLGEKIGGTVGGIGGGIVKGISEVHGLATARANLEVAKEIYGADSDKVKAAEAKIQKAADETFADNLVPKPLQNGSMILGQARRMLNDFQNATGNKITVGGGTSSTGGAGASDKGPRVTPKTTLRKDKDDSYEPDRTPASVGSAVGESTPESRAAARDAARNAGSVSIGTAAGLSGSGMKAGAEVGTGVGGTDRTGPMNKGGLMRRSNPVKKK